MISIIDERKQFILRTAGNYFRHTVSLDQEEKLKNNNCLNNFLEDSSCFILTVKNVSDSQISLENALLPGEGKETILVFFKIRPEVVTEENIGHIVFVVSMPDSPVVALYHTLQRIFSPTLLKDDRYSHTVEPRLQTILTDLESSLRSVVLRAQDPSISPSASLTEIMTVEDELHFWSGCLNQSKKKSEQEKAKAFIEVLEPLVKAVRQLQTMEVADAEDVVEAALNSLDDLWKLDEFRYSQERMEHLMEIIGKLFTSFIQKKLKSENIWEGDFVEVEAMLSQCLAVCNKWIQTCEKLTTLFWPNHSLHRWSGLPYMPYHIAKFAIRLKEILNIRTVDRQLTKLLSPNEQAQLNSASNFKPFTGVNAVQYNPYTEPLWQAAVKQFELHIQPAEERVAAKLKHQLRNANLNTFQLLQEFKRYQEIIKRPGIQRALVAERETLLSRLQDYVASIDMEAKDSHLRLVDMPAVVSQLCWLRQLEAKVLEIEKLSDAILDELGSYPVLKRAVDNLKRELKDYHTEQFDAWTRETGSAIKNRTLGLKTEEPVVHFEQGKLMHVNYNPALVGLVQGVRQLSVMGYNIPSHIRDTAELARQFMQQARTLQQVATFHNTIGDRMIASQRPMMLAAAMELAKLVREQHNVTWSNTTAVDTYINKLQAVVDRLYRENNQLAHCHNTIADKVVALMSTDLLRHQQQWKEGLREIRELMAQVETQFSNMKSWRVHWDHQIYKALEHQYQLGLEALNHHMPEIRVDIVYRQQKLQLSPPLEELRMKYYGQLKRFMAIPLSFRGVCDTSIFPAIIDHNAHRFARVYKRAEELFVRLSAACLEWGESVALGSVDIDALCREHLTTANDWDVNFRASKAWSQEIAKLITSERKIECFTINVGPVCNEIELHNRKYWDTLASSLYASIMVEIAEVDKFVLESKKTLQVQPQRLDEVGAANTHYLSITQKAVQMQEMLMEVQKKNVTLASWTKEKVEQVSALTAAWDNFQIQLHNQQYLISKQVETMKTNLSASVENMVADVERFQLCWDQFKPREDSLSTSDSLEKGLEVIRGKRAEWDQLLGTVNKLREDHIQFQMPPPEFPLCKQIEADLKQYEETWALFDNFNTDLMEMAKEEWIVFRGKSQLKLAKFIDDWSEKLSKIPTTALTVRLLQELEQYKDILPALKYLRGEMFSEKHWVEMFNIIKAPFKAVDILTFADFLDVRQNIKANLDNLMDLNSRAASEVVIRQALAELDIWEVEAKFSITPHIDSKGRTCNLIKHFNDIMSKVGDNQCLLQSIKSSPNYNNFQDRAGIWETRLSDLDNFLRNLNQIQRKWVYLEPIFGSGTLKMDKGRFERVDRDLMLILSDLEAADYKVITLCRIPHLHNTLQILLQQLTHCQKCLLDYLEEKRLRFPRFYFLGDEDLLEILGQANKQHVIQSHLKKLFSGIHTAVFKEGRITAMQSLHGETVELSSPVEVTQDIEEWLSCLSKEMKRTLKNLVKKCFQSPDPVQFPSQVLCLAERVSFTSRCEKAIQSAGLRDLLSALKNQLGMYTKYQLESAGQGDVESAVLELKLKALQLDVIYHINVVEQLLESGVSSVDDWEWQRRLRFYLRQDDMVVARMVDAEFVYSYEYQGNATKLVHTPLTDKCYLTLTQAMSMGLGGNPYGPAGTGKTESVKALGGLLGRQVLVFNCDEGIDVQSLTRILVGLVKCGAWGCFDEFNRLEEATLSAISMQIHPIQEALRNNTPSVSLMGQEVTVDGNTGIFVTLNPAGQGYAGRQKLPDNLKQLFRPVVMSKPDDTLIAQVILHCEGFKHAKVIGTKLVILFDLARKLLSKQQHYDWGLRALKTVVGGCGSALGNARINNVNIDSTEGEMALAVKALRLNTLSKLTSADSRSFDNLVQDMFPGVPFNATSHDQMALAIRESFHDLHLVHNIQQERKCLELHEQLKQRMGVVVVGPSGSGKSTLIKQLKNALGHYGVTVKQFIINAKALSHTQLLGCTDLDTRQWQDGVLSTTAQAIYAEPPDVECWIVFDGDVDPEWIESLNSVLDDNRLLTLPSGWRIQFGPNVHFLFETHDLTHASPATISRMGMLLLSSNDVDRKNLVEAWLLTQPPDIVGILSQYIDEYFYKAVDWVLEQGQMAVASSPVAVVKSGLSHMAGVVSRAHFTVALVNGLAANLIDSSRQELCKQVLEWTGEFVPGSSSPQYLSYEARRDTVDIFVDRGLSDSHNLVLTAQMCSAAEVLTSWLCTCRPFILIGPHGCGKSLLLDYCFSQLHNVEVATIHCSAQISPQHILQKLSQLCMVVSSSSGRIYRPARTQTLVLHLKNTHLVSRDKWGSNMLTAWLQQVLTYGGFYDGNLEWVGLENVLFVFSLSSSESISPRFLANNLVYNLTCPGRAELKTIYGEITRSILSPSKNNKMAATLATTMVNVYLEVIERFSNATHDHYVFTPADLTSWCYRLLRYPLSDNQAIIEALLHEGMRQFGDKLVSEEERATLDQILAKVFNKDFNLHLGSNPLKDVLFVNEPPGTLDGQLLRVSFADCRAIVERTLNQLGQSNVLVLPELVHLTARVERVLSSSGGALLLAGCSGVGRKTAVKVVATRQGASIYSPNITHSYTITNFKADLKNAMQMAAVEGEQVYLVLEDYQLIHPEFLDLINSLLSSGEVPGLYQVEELEATASVLRELAAQTNFDGSISQYFASRVKKNLHVVLVLESSHDKFTSYCMQNPALLKCCSVLWTDHWSMDTMSNIPRIMFSRMKSAVGEELLNLVDVFKLIHLDCAEICECSPRRFLSFVETYLHIYKSRITNISETKSKLQAGVSKLTAARQMVDTLKLEAAEQEKLLADKQAKATAALEMITETMSNANAHRGDMDQLKIQTEKENNILQIRKKEIESELAEIEPLIEEARAAVGNIKSESLSEIRSLRAPPEVIRDILEGVLRLMGIQDTSWNSMKTFLAKRGVKEDIRCFDARNISPENRESVEVLLSERRDSFNAKTAKRASQAAAPLAAWVTANVKFSLVLEKIRPLEREQANLHRNLKLAEDRIEQLSTGLQDVDKTVAELKDRLNRFTKEAAELEIHLGQAQETICGAQNLVHKLDFEYSRWQAQLNELSESLSLLPQHCLLAAAFITYLSASPQDVRRKMLEKWCGLVHVTEFSLTEFLCSERQQLLWQSQGLPADLLSVENAIIITTISNLETASCQKVFILDPSSVTVPWLRNNLSEENVEVVSQSSPRFHTNFDLAVRFGKKLIIQDVDEIEPTVYPVLRGDVSQQDGRNSLRVFHVSRSVMPLTEPHVSAVLCQINFTTTAAGLTQQLVQAALRQEKPQLEVRRGELLRREEELKMSLHQLQENVLHELANAHGDILQNKELLASLNETKRSSNAISESLEESARLKAALQTECDVYQGLAEFGSRLYFAITDLSRLNNMYCLSIPAFLAIFQKTVSNPAQDEMVWRQSLLQDVYLYMARSLFKEDTLAFALHLTHIMCSSLFQPNVLPPAFIERGFESKTKTSVAFLDLIAAYDTVLRKGLFIHCAVQHVTCCVISLKGEGKAKLGNNNLELMTFTGSGITKKHNKPKEWELLMGQTVTAKVDASQMSHSVPAWLPEDRANAIFQLQSVLPQLYSQLHLELDSWRKFPENESPVSLSSFQRVLMVQALRPDLLHSALSKFALQALGLSALSPPPLRLSRVLAETRASEPVLILSCAGTDPSQELRQLALSSHKPYHEVALGQGQETLVSQMLSEASSQGHWLCLKNLHLMSSWLPTLEKQLQNLSPHQDFRLWLTSEPHTKFPQMLVIACLKVTYEAPRGVKRNLLRSYGAWETQAEVSRAQFVLAWFHAVVQERRTYIPQGWVKLYEFNDSDLHAALHVLKQRLTKDGRQVRWPFVQGLGEAAIYGGRVDNVYDLKVLSAYFQAYFNNSTFIDNKPLAPGVYVPSSNSYQEHKNVIEKLPDHDSPSFFGLPANVDRSWQRITSASVVDKLKVLGCCVDSPSNLDRQTWQGHLSPVLNLWKKLNQGTGYIKMRLPDVRSDLTPVAVFLSQEFHFGVLQVQQIHKGLSAVTRVIKGMPSPTVSTQLIAHSLILGKTPELWQKNWSGPESPMQYLNSVMARVNALSVLKDSFSSRIDLAQVFHPDIFFSSLRHQASREKQVPIDELEQVCSWTAAEDKGAVKLEGLQLEGASLSSNSLTANSPDSPDVTTAPPLTVYWTAAQKKEEGLVERMAVPLYLSALREVVVTELKIPSRLSEHNKWVLAGTAFYIRS